MNATKALMLLMAVESLAASIVHLFSRNWKMGAYWFLVAALDAVVSTF